MEISSYLLMFLPFNSLFESNPTRDALMDRTSKQPPLVIYLIEMVEREWIKSSNIAIQIPIQSFLFKYKIVLQRRSSRYLSRTPIVSLLHLIHQNVTILPASKQTKHPTTTLCTVAHDMPYASAADYRGKQPPPSLTKVDSLRTYGSRSHLNAAILPAR